MANRDTRSEETGGMRRGLPVTRSRIDRIFPKLTQAQIDRVALYGRTRSVKRGDILIEQGDSPMPFFVVISGEIEDCKPLRHERDSHNYPW